jgi:hypothetical protein
VTRGRRALAVATLLVSVAVAWAPLVHGPGYEHALVLGILLPAPFAGVLAADRRRGVSGSAVARQWALVLALILVGACTPWFHYGACAPLHDLAYEVGTLGTGLAVAALWAVHAARLVPSRASIALASAGPIASLLVALGVFFATPTVHAFDAFAGYFAGPLYDTVLRLEGPFAAHRAAVAVWIALALVLASSIAAPAPRSSSAIALLSLSLIGAAGPLLGTWTTRRMLASSLPQESVEGGCIVHASGSIKPELVARVARDAAERRREIEEAFSTAFTGPIHVFVFRDGDEKGRLMGAADTLVAKPWRGEVYVQGTSYPHPVLGHELAHVIAGSFARGPLRIAGRFGGLVANPGLIEGVAVSAAPHDESLSEREWSSAMLARGLLPSLEELFGLGFLGGNASRGYTAAGAFVDFVRERYGVAALKRWYAGDELTALVAAPWSSVESAFHAWLANERVSQEGQRVAQARFGAPGLASRRCAHVVDGALATAEACLRDHRLDEAERALNEARALDGKNTGVQLLDAALGSATKAERAYLDLAAATDASALVRDEALGRAADLAWRAGRPGEALARFRELDARVVDEGRRRVLEFKQAFAADVGTPPVIVAFLTQGALRGDAAGDAFVLGAALSAWGHEGASPAQRAFLAQQFFLRDQCDGGLALASSLRREDLTPAVARAMLRGRLVCSCLNGRPAAVRAALDAIDAQAALFPSGAGRSLRSLGRRCVTRESTTAAKKSLTDSEAHETTALPPRE